MSIVTSRCVPWSCLPTLGQGVFLEFDPSYVPGARNSVSGNIGTVEKTLWDGDHGPGINTRGIDCIWVDRRYVHRGCDSTRSRWSHST